MTATKPAFFLTAILTITLLAADVSCKKQGSQVVPNGCISRTPPPPNFDPSISAAYIDSIKTRFAANQLDYTKHSFTGYFPTVAADSLTEPGTSVTAFQVLNGLPVFNSYETFIFLGTKLDSAYVGAARPASGDSSANETLTALQSAYLAHVEESKVYSSLSSGRSLTAEQVKDSCEVATLGYLDASRIPGSNLAPDIQLVKAWSVSLSSGGASAVLVLDGTHQAWGEVFLFP